MVAVAGVGASAVRSGVAEAETVTSVQAEQLLPSFDSEIVPDMDILLSAQRRTE